MPIVTSYYSSTQQKVHKKRDPSDTVRVAMVGSDKFLLKANGTRVNAFCLRLGSCSCTKEQPKSTLENDGGSRLDISQIMCKGEVKACKQRNKSLRPLQMLASRIDPMHFRIAFGLRDSWVAWTTKADDGDFDKIAWSLAKPYKDLRKKLKACRSYAPRFVTLGVGFTWFIMWSNGRFSNNLKNCYSELRSHLGNLECGDIVVRFRIAYHTLVVDTSAVPRLKPF